MLVVRKRVDDRDAADAGEGLHLVLPVGADDDAVDVAGEDASSVLDALAPTELEVVHAEEEGGTAELADADLEGDARAGGGLAEDERPRLATEGLRVGRFPTQGLEAEAEGHKSLDVGDRQRLDGEQVFQGEKVSRS